MTEKEWGSTLFIFPSGIEESLRQELKKEEHKLAR